MNTPLIEIELQLTAPAFPDPVGKRLKNELHRDRFQFVDRDLLAKSPFANQGQASPISSPFFWFKKTIQQYDQYGCGV